MKRNQWAVIYIVMLCLGTIASLYIPNSESVQASEEAVVIPKEAIRLRILANSDSEKDQTIKRAVRDEVNANITEWVAELTTLEDARKVINSHLSDIQSIAEKYVKEHGLDQDVTVEFGRANFPTKLYGQYLYPAGEYEAIVITIGAGQGANWWCVLFPPLCFLDFSNGTAVMQSPMEDSETERDLNTLETKQTSEEGTESSVEIDEQQVSTQNMDNLIGIDEESAVNGENQQKEESIYVEQDGEPQVLEKKIFVVEFFRDLF